MNQSITQFLISKGFHQKDIEIYLDIYRHSQSYASSIATRTSIDRTTVYSVIKRLLKSAIITQTKLNGVRAYLALSPEIFLDKIDRDIDELTSQKKTTQNFIDEMAKVKKQRTFEKPKIQIFEGDEAIMSLYQYTLAAGGQQKSFLTIKRIPESLSDFLKNQYIKMKIKHRVHSRVLIANTGFAPKYKSMDARSNRTTKIVTKHPFDLHSEVIMFNTNEVAIIDFHKQIYGIIIKSDTLYKTTEALFDYIWASE